MNMFKLSGRNQLEIRLKNDRIFSQYDLWQRSEKEGVTLSCICI